MQRGDGVSRTLVNGVAQPDRERAEGRVDRVDEPVCRLVNDDVAVGGERELPFAVAEHERDVGGRVVGVDHVGGVDRDRQRHLPVLQRLADLDHARAGGAIAG